MAKVESTVEVPLTPEVAWERASDLTRLPDWVTVHDGWRSALPEELKTGVAVTSVVKAKGLRNRVDWKISDYQPPRRLVLEGRGKAGTKYTLTVGVTPQGTGAKIALRADLGGTPFFGPVGAGVARALKGDIEQSLSNYITLFV